MTLGEVLDTVATLKQHPYAKKLLLSELTRLDGRVLKEIQREKLIEAPTYDEATAAETVLLVPQPYDALYIHYLCARVDYWNGELERCNCDTALFTEAWNAYAAQVVREAPVRSARILM